MPNTAYHGPKAVGGAGRVRGEVLAHVVLVGVDAHDNNLGVVLDRGQVKDLLDAAIDDGLGGLLEEEDACGLADVVSIKSVPPNLLGVAAAGGLDLLAVEDGEVPVDPDDAFGNAVDDVVLTREDDRR